MERSLLRSFSNRILHSLARTLPGAWTLRPYLHKLRGVKIYGTIFIGDDVYIENAYPEQVEIHDNSRIGLRSTIMSHFRGKGRVIIEKNVWTGPCCTIIAAGGETRRIGEGSAIAAGAVVNRDIEPFTFVGGVPAKPIAKVTKPIAVVKELWEFREGLRPLK